MSHKYNCSLEKETENIMLAETFLSLIPNQTWAIGSGIMIYQNSPAGLAGLVGVMPLSYDRSQILDLGLLKSHIMNELFWSRSAWLIESHWSSCRLPGKTNSSASRSGNHVARSGSKT
jgi:hypothetical protein